MEEVKLTAFRDNAREYFKLAVESNIPIRITNRKNKNGDAVLISAEEYERLISRDFLLKNGEDVDAAALVLECTDSIKSDASQKRLSAYLAAYSRSIADLEKRVEMLEKSIKPNSSDLERNC